MSNSEIRRKILQMLYDSFTEHPYNRTTPKEFKETMDIGLKELHFNIIYLEEKGYVELSKPLEGSVFVGARITPRGVDLVEDECEFDVLFPQQPIAHQVSTDMLQRFDVLTERANESPGLSGDSKELIREELKSIRDELTKNQPAYSIIKKNVDRIKNRTPEIWHELIEMLREPAISRLLSDAARRELEQ
jgi:hypothetical protein